MTKKGRPPIGKQAMSATERDRHRRAAQRLPWWQRTKAKQKADIEAAVREFLDRDMALTERELYCLAEALTAVGRGLFGIAAQQIQFAHEPESSFSPQFKIPPDDFTGTTVEALRAALDYSEGCPVREIPDFSKFSPSKSQA